MSHQQLIDLLSRAQRGVVLEHDELRALQQELKGSSVQDDLHYAAELVMQPWKWKVGTSELQSQVLAALVENPATSNRILQELSRREVIVSQHSGALVLHPNADERVLLELAYTASQSLLGIPGIYDTLEEVAPGFGRAAEFVERLGIHELEYEQAVTGLRGENEAVRETFATLLLDPPRNLSVSECLKTAKLLLQ